MKPGRLIDAKDKTALASPGKILATLIESSDDPIWSVGLDFGLLTINQAARRLLEAELGFQAPIGARPVDLLAPEEAAI
jgi:PAS domain-containing protein